MSNVTNFEPLLAFTMGHIPTKLHQFLFSSFRDFVWTDRQTLLKQYLFAACAQIMNTFQHNVKGSHSFTVLNATITIAIPSVRPLSQDCE